MRQDVKRIWVDALRSGKYERGYFRLRTCVGSFCCLGVLCDAVGAKWGDYNRATAVDGTDMGDVKLSDAMRFEAGISNDQVSRLIRMNDVDNKSFSAIADYIEANL